MLHILTKGSDSAAADQMLQVMEQDDVVVLIEEGVMAALNLEWEGWQRHFSHIFVLVDDAYTRGLKNIVTTNNLPMLQMDEFVALTEQHEQTITWY